jgi:hypothetical protein
MRRALEGALKCAFRDLRLELLTPAKTNPAIMISFPEHSTKKYPTKQNKSNNFSMRKQTNKQTKQNKTKQNKKVRKEKDECKELEIEKLTRRKLHGCCWYHFRHREEEKERWRRCCTSGCLGRTKWFLNSTLF